MGPSTKEPFPSMGKGRDGVEAPASRKQTPLGADLPVLFEHERHGPGVVKRARRLRSEMTVAEKLLWKELRKFDLHVRRQAPIGRFVADFAHHASRIVIEVDSPWHDGDEAQLRDAERDAWLKGQGYRTVRVEGNDVLKDPAAMAERIASLIERTMAARGASAERREPSNGSASTPTPAPPPLRGRGSEGP